MHVVVPGANENAIVGLTNEVVANVVNDDCLCQVTAQQSQVFDEEGAVLRGVLSIETVLDVVACVDLVDYLICVLLHCCCKDDDFVVFSHCFDELNTAWSD